MLTFVALLANMDGGWSLIKRLRQKWKWFQIKNDDDSARYSILQNFWAHARIQSLLHFRVSALLFSLVTISTSRG